MPGQDGSARLERVEKLMELLIDDHLRFSDEHRQLLTSQVLLTDRMDRLTITMQELAEAQKVTGDQMKETDERLSILIRMMDDFIRRRDKDKPV